MNNLTFTEFWTGAGFCSIIYLVARLLHNWFNFRMENSSDTNESFASGLLTTVLAIVFSILYFFSLPYSAFSYIIHLGTVKMAIKADRNEFYKEHKEVERIQEKVAYDSGYKEGRSSGYKVGHEDGWFACAEHNSSPKAFDEGRKVGYNHGVKKGYEQGWSKGYDSGYKIAETHKFEEIDVSEYENNKHLGLVNSYTGEPINNQYDYVKYITRKNEK